MFTRDPERHEGRDQFKQHVGHAAGPYQGDRDTVELDQQLLRVTLDQAGSSPDRGGRKYPGQQDSGHSADTVDAEHIEGIVVVEAVLQPGAGPEAHQARDHPDDDAVPDRPRSLTDYERGPF